MLTLHAVGVPALLGAAPAPLAVHALAALVAAAAALLLPPSTGLGARRAAGLGLGLEPREQAA